MSIADDPWIAAALDRHITGGGEPPENGCPLGECDCLRPEQPDVIVTVVQTSDDPDDLSETAEECDCACHRRAAAADPRNDLRYRDLGL